MLIALILAAPSEALAQDVLQPTLGIQKLLILADGMPDGKARLRALIAAIAAAHAAKDRFGEAEGAFFAGQTASRLFQWSRAIEFFVQAGGLYTAVGAKRDVGAALHELGVVYDLSGDRPRAIQALQDALLAEENAGDEAGKASTFLALGKVYDDLGRRRDALDACLKAQAFFHASDPQREAVSLNAIGKIYEELGQRPKALDAYTKGLSLFRRVGDPRGQAQTLTNMGVTHDNLGNPMRAVALYNQALPLWGNDLPGKAATLNDIGKALKEMGQYAKALTFYARSLAARRKVGDKQGEAITLNNIGRVYVEQKQPQRALDAYAVALRLEREVGHREAEAITLRNAAYAFDKLGQTVLAIAYAKQSVNLFQTLRSELKPLPPEFRRSYSGEVEPAYRFLADHLIERGRLAEAEEVMGLLKDEEYFQFMRSGRSEKVDLTAHEAEWKAKYEALGGALAKDATEYEALVRLAKAEELTVEQIKRKTELSSRLSASRVAFSAFLKSAEQSFASGGAASERLTELKTSTELALIVQQLPNQPAAIYTLVTEDGVRTVLTLPRLTELKDGTSAKIPFAELSKKVAKLRTALTSPSHDPIPLASELYDILVRPIEKDLNDAGVASLLWSLDGPLRYLPVGALYDRETKQFLCQKYACSLFTPAKLLGMVRAPTARPTAAGFGVSQPHDVGSVHFAGLTGVGSELATLHRLLGAQIYQDAAFTEAALMGALEKSPQIVHLATHFRLKPGDASESFILLGDGKTLTISSFAVWMQSALSGVDLFVLSACDTATPVGSDADGGELESFSRSAQENGAAAVIATLWPVNDASTSLLMSKFYELRASLPKLEALRQAQLWLLRAGPKDLPVSGPRAGAATPSVDKDLPPFKPDPEHPFAHPYYWAPFVLIGNPK